MNWLLLLPAEAARGVRAVNVPSAVPGTDGLSSDAGAGLRTSINDSEMKDVKRLFCLWSSLI